MDSRVTPTRKRGFSLVELSIVLVILGLLVGGVLSGQSLIHAAELRAITEEYTKYAAATHTFRDKYFALPGDMTNATAFWGKNNSYCAGNPGAVSSPGTCNGDGSGTIEYAPSTGNSGEFLQYWNQLALAGLIEGTYTGIANSGGIGLDSIVGVSIPGSKYPNGAWGVENNPLAEAGDDITFVMSTGNAFMYGAPVAASSNFAPALAPQDAWNIDSKIDDGKPGSGSIVAMYWNDLCSSADNGSSANTNLAASYRLSDSSVQCALKFRHAF